MYVLILTHFVNYVQNTPISVFPQQTVKNGKPTLCLTRDCSTETETDYSFFNAFYKFFNYNVQFSSSDDFLNFVAAKNQVLWPAVELGHFNFSFKLTSIFNQNISSVSIVKIQTQKNRRHSIFLLFNFSF